MSSFRFKLHQFSLFQLIDHIDQLILHVRLLSVDKMPNCPSAPPKTYFSVHIFKLQTQNLLSPPLSSFHPQFSSCFRHTI